jgi:hypothetical protein
MRLHSAALLGLLITPVLVAAKPTASLRAQGTSFTVTLEPLAHGTLRLTPPLPEEGRYPAGTVITLTPAPDAGYVLDSAWYSVSGRFGQMYHESAAREFKVTIDQDKRAVVLSLTIVDFRFTF